MSVIVNGMEMPTTCCDCKFREPFIDFAYCNLAEMDMEYEESDNCRHPDCPLVEIPTPHGRLIDADEIETPCLETTADQKWMEIAIKSTPTVIEAEGSDE